MNGPSDGRFSAARSSIWCESAADIRASRQTPQDTTLKLAPSWGPRMRLRQQRQRPAQDFPRLRIGHQEVGLEEIGHAETQAPAQRAAINALSRDLESQLSHEQRRDQRCRLASDIQGGRLGRWGWGTTAVQEVKVAGNGLPATIRQRGDNSRKR